MKKISVWASEFSPEQRIFQWFYRLSESVCNYPNRIWDNFFKVNSVAKNFSAHFYARQFGEFNVISLRSTPCRISYYDFPESYLFPSRKLLILQRKGRSQYRQNNKVVALQSGDWGVFDMGSGTEVIHEEDTSLIMVTFPSSSVDLMLLMAEVQLPFRFESAREKKSKLFYGAALMLISDELTYSEETGESILKSLFFLLQEAISGYDVVSCNSIQSKKLYYRDLSLQYLSAHLDDTAFSIRKMAEALRVSVRTLNRVMGGEQGEGAKKLLWKMRVEQASQKLKLRSNDRFTLTDIAYSCGFSSASHFCRKFKEHWGVTPTQFRRRHLESCG